MERSPRTTLTRRRRFLAIAAAAIAISVGFVRYPMYPTSKTLCGLVQERGDAPRFASPHRGAVIRVHGVLHGGPDGMYLLESICSNRRLFVAVRVACLTIASAETRRTLRDLTGSDWRHVDRSVPVVMFVRVTSEVQSCFGPGMVVTALSATRAGEPRAAPRVIPKEATGAR